METICKLDSLINPKNIAIIGVSENLNKIGGRPLKFLLDNNYEGDIFPVNPKYDEIHGMKCYHSVADIKDAVDLAIIALPAKLVVDTVALCAQNDVKAIIIFSSGFAETGTEGKAAQEELTKIAEDNDIIICGPNSVGIINIPKGVGATMSQILEQKVTSAPIALVSQSGAYGTFITALAQEEGLGFNYFVSTGNEANLEFSDYVEYLVKQKDVKVIAGYIEGIRDGDKLKKAASLAIEKEKPIVIIKVGSSEIGRKAASSHTGSITGTDNVYDTFFNQYGILRVNNEEELLDLLVGLNSDTLPKGRGVGVLSMSGGAGIQIADEIEKTGLKVASLEKKTKDNLRNVIPSFGSVSNPIDLTGQVIPDPGLLTKSINILNKDKNIDIIVFFLGLGWSFGDKIADDLIEISKHTDKMIAVSWVAGKKETIDKLRKHKIIVFSSISRTIGALSKLVQYKEFLEEKNLATDLIESKEKKVLDLETEKFLMSALEQGKNSVSESESKWILDKFNIPIPKVKTLQTKQEAVEFADNIGYPVVAKVDAPSILHKSDADTVKLNIRDKDELMKAYDDVIINARKYNPNAVINGVLIEEMISGSTEVIIGVTFDEQFGPIIMFGLGGIYVELFKDFSLRLAPLSDESAIRMIKETKAYEILKGYRGSQKLDIEAIVNVLLNVSRLSIALKDYVSEIDINPIIVKESGEGVVVADALIILKDTSKKIQLTL